MEDLSLFLFFFLVLLLLLSSCLPLSNIYILNIFTSAAIFLPLKNLLAALQLILILNKKK